MGIKYPPTQKVDVFVTEAAIKKQYTIIGKGYVSSAGNFYNSNYQTRIQNLAITKAKAAGADAVFFYDYYVTQNGTFISSTNQISKDSTTGTISSKTNTSIINNAITQKQEILFLKYD